MRAMIFAAGLGTRLKPFTLHHPKALVPVGGIPMLERVIIRLRDIGVSEMVVNVHHFARQIIDFLDANDNFGVDIHISDESTLLLDTGGGILAARQWLDTDGQPFIVHNADILTDIDFTAMANQHIQTGATSTLLVASRETSRYLLFDDDMRMRGWTNIKTGDVRPQGIDATGLRRLAFGGIHVMSPAIFDMLEAYAGAGKPFSITDFYINACDRADFYGYMQSGPYMWHDIGKPETLAAAQQNIK